MQPSDRRAFAEALNQLFAIYGDEVTDRMRDAWWGVLAPYHLNAVLAAMNLHAGDKQAGMFRPTPAHIKKHLEDTIPELMRDRRDAIVRDARERIAPLQEHIHRVEADVVLGLVTRDKANELVAHTRRCIATIMSEPDVVAALAPAERLREQHAVAPKDRMPEVVRKALGWLGRVRG